MAERSPRIERKVRASDNSKRLEAKTGGHWFVKLLQTKEVEFVFGTTGAGMPDIQDAMVVVKPPKWVQGLHEFVTISAASGYALASGRAGVALIDRVVGTQNAIGAFYGAYLNSSPLVAFASSNVPGVPIPTQAVELHYSNYMLLLVSPWVKWFTQVHDLATLPEDVDKAFNMALSEHKGPVYVALRQDLMAKSVHEGRSVGTENPLSPRVPDDSTLKRIVDGILTHENPQIVVSHLGRNPRAVASLVRFAHVFGVAVGERRFFLNCPISDPMHVGFLSRYDSPEVLSSTDLVLALEIGLLPHQTFGNDVDVVDIASDPLHRQDVYAGGDYGSSLFPAIVRAACDVGPTLERLIEIGKEVMTNSDKEKIRSRTVRIAKLHDKMLSKWRETAARSYNRGILNDWSIGYVLNKHWSPEMSWVNGAASSWEVLLRTIELSRPGTYFSNPSGHLGLAPGMAYGVALAHTRYQEVKDKGAYRVGRIRGSGHIVLCTVGDGDAIFGNIDSALWTCSHYGIGVLYVILNNACWGVEWPPIESSSQHWAAKAKDYEFLDVDNPRIDFGHIARAYNVHARSVDTPQHLDSAMREAKKIVRRGRPALLNVNLAKHTGPMASVVP